MILLSFLLDTNLSDPWELDCSFMEPDRPGESEAVPDSSPLETGETNLLPNLESSVKVLERSMKVSERFLRCTLGCFVHP